MQGRLDAQIGRNRHHLEGARAGREDVKFDHDLLLLLELTMPFTGLISSLGSKQGRPKIEPERPSSRSGLSNGEDEGNCAFVKSQTRFAARSHCDHSWRTTVLDIDARGQCLLSFAILARSCAKESLGLSASPTFQPTRACLWLSPCACARCAR